MMAKLCPIWISVVLLLSISQLATEQSLDSLEQVFIGRVKGSVTGSTSHRTTSKRYVGVFETVPSDYLAYYFRTTLYLVFDLCKYGPITAQMREQTCSACMFNSGNQLYHR